MITEHADREGPGDARSSSAVLADRIAVMVLDRDPGWRLVRPSMLARRYDASVAAVEAALEELIRRGLLRRLPDGHLCRPSSAECLITLSGIAGLGACVDPLGASVACVSTHASVRLVPEDIGLMLGLPPGSEATTVRSFWTANGERAAMTTTYARGRLHLDEGHAEQNSPDRALNSASAGSVAWDAQQHPVPAAVQVEIQPPGPAVVRYLQLPVGVPAAAVAVRFDDQSLRCPVAMTTAFLRCDLFRIVIEASAAGPPALALDSSKQWARPAEEWEP